MSTATVSPVATAGPTIGGAVRPELPGKLAFQRDNAVYVYRPQTGAVQLLVTGARVARWSPDGTRLAYVQEDELFVAQADGSQARRIVVNPYIVDVRWAPDGTRLLLVERDAEALVQAGNISVVDFVSSNVYPIGAGYDPAWAPDSKRIAYVTAPTTEFPRRSTLRLVNWQGKNGWTPVKDVPTNAPPLGIPDDKRQPNDFEHVLFSPIWDASGATLYFGALAVSQVETDFGMWERADARNGGSVFVNEVVNVVEAVGSPDRKVAVLEISTARGDSFFEPQPLGTNGTYDWLKTEAGFSDYLPTWSPDSQALAYYHCQFEQSYACDLVIRTPRGVTSVISSIRAADAAPDLPELSVLDWAVDP